MVPPTGVEPVAHLLANAHHQSVERRSLEHILFDFFPEIQNFSTAKWTYIVDTEVTVKMYKL